MAEFSINNSVHASTSHKPFFVNGLRHSSLPAFLECDSRLMGGGWTRSSRNRSGSCSSHIDDDTAVDVVVADVDAIDVGATDTDDDDDDAGLFSIANDYSEDEHSITEEDKDLLAVRTTHTARKKDESAEEFLLIREAVVHFVQDYSADAVDKKKRKAYKHGRANVLSF